MLKKKVLIVDENESNADLMNVIFIEEGYLTKTLFRTLNLSEVIEEFNPEVILMDLQLEDADGRILCNEIKNNPKNQGIHVVLITATLEQHIGDIPCQPDLIVTKPFDIYELAAQVNQLLN